MDQKSRNGLAFLMACSRSTVQPRSMAGIWRVVQLQRQSVIPQLFRNRRGQASPPAMGVADDGSSQRCNRSTGATMSVAASGAGGSCSRSGGCCCCCINIYVNNNVQGVTNSVLVRSKRKEQEVPAPQQQEAVKNSKVGWSKEDDDLLRERVREHGDKGWRFISRMIPGHRSGKSCRNRWTQHLDPRVNAAQPFTADEDDRNVELQLVHSNRWATIAAFPAAPTTPSRTAGTPTSASASSGNGRRCASRCSL
ncbi:hypothetical protein E2562_002054 [Oryza meyeriana var. granulata]|uniref:Uncharacterized protein n=1 Tax=Oryza meyeriana var. granulata TaxID=110450 RepID=A0A6G1EEG3_9ORYZ|nr:hypothetical protein E2562_002054 [Oryza meyeriana var. granulata]